MADVKFSELSTLSAAASADVFAIVDTSESASKQLSIDNLFGAVPVNLAITDLTQSTSNTTGSLTTTGGIGVSKDAYVGGALNVFGATDIDGTVQIDNTVTVGVDDTGYDVKFFGDTSGNYWLWDTSADGTVQVGNSQLTGTLTVGVDDTGYDVKLFGATASSVLVWDESDDQLEFGNAAMTISDARTSTTQSLTGLTIDMYNKLDTGSSNDRIGAAISTYGDTSTYEIRDSVGIRAMSRQSTGAEVTRLNTPLHAVLDLANTAIANNSGTTLSGAYGLAIDHDDTIATRTGQPTAFISFGELYVGGTSSIETAYLFDIFPEGKTGDATYGTAADLSFYDDAAIIAAERDAVILNSTDGSPATDAGDLIVLETMDGDAYTPSRILEESHTDVNLNDGMPDQYNYIVMEDATGDGTTPYIMLDTVAESGGILDTEGGKVIFEDGTQSADGTIKIRINGEDKYIQVYNTY